MGGGTREDGLAHMRTNNAEEGTLVVVGTCKNLVNTLMEARGFGVLSSGRPDVAWAVASQQDGSGTSVHLQRPTRAFTS